MSDETAAAAPGAGISAGKRVLAIGIGGSGLKILSALSEDPRAAWLDTVGIDTDSAALRDSKAKIKMEVASESWVRSGTGCGCGGDVMRGERALARDRARLIELMKGYSLVLVIAGLGGGTATGGLRTLASVARNVGIPSVFVLSTPFSFEAYSRKKNAENCMNELLPVTDILLCMPNDLLFSTLPANTTVEEAFRKAALEMARTLLGIAWVMRSSDLISTDFANFMSLLHGKRSFCGVGVGVASAEDGLDRCAVALERMLESPFLGGLAKMESADAAILTLCGGPDLQIGEMKRTLEQASEMLPKGVELITGAAASEFSENSVQLTTIAIKYEQSIETIPVRKDKKVWGSTGSPARAGRSADMEQGMLELPTFSKGIFGNIAPTKYRDEDLDIPTFQRRNIAIDKGTSGR